MKKMKMKIIKKMNNLKKKMKMKIIKKMMIMNNQNYLIIMLYMLTNKKK